MVLPDPGIDLRSHFKTIRNAGSKWRPATQAVFLYALMHDHAQGLTPKGLADQLGYAPMSMSRALDELETAGLGRVAMEGRQRVLRLERNRRALWEKAQGFLRDPVRKRVWVRLLSSAHPGVEAGLTALARYSALSAPANPVYALDRKEWKELSLNGCKERPIAEQDACQLEIWGYSPRLFSEDGVADRFSLYLSLKNTDDERVESALQEMIEVIRW